MVDWQIQDQAQAPRVGLLQQLAQIVQTAVLRIYGAVVRHVILVVAGGGHDGHEPDAADAQGGHIVQFVPDTVQIPDPVAVAVGEGADEDFVPVDARLRLGTGGGE